VIISSGARRLSAVTTTDLFMKLLLNLHYSGVESPFCWRAGDIAKKANKDVARFVRLDDGIDPAARGAVTNVGLLFVTGFYSRA
jgi:hypothetical protein